MTLILECLNIKFDYFHLDDGFSGKSNIRRARFNEKKNYSKNWEFS